MTQVEIQAQVEAIKKATQKATQSKESATKFLVEAGIINEVKPAQKTKSKK